MSRYGFRPHRRPESRPAPVTTYEVCDNGVGVRARDRSYEVATAMAVCAARATGYGAVSICSDGVPQHVDIFRRGDKDGHVYGWRYNRDRFQDEQYVIAPAGMVLP